MLVEAGARLHAQTPAGLTAAHFASLGGHAEMLELLLDAGTAAGTAHPLAYTHSIASNMFDLTMRQ